MMDFLLNEQIERALNIISPRCCSCLCQSLKPESNNSLHASENFSLLFEMKEYKHLEFILSLLIHAVFL